MDDIEAGEFVCLIEYWGNTSELNYQKFGNNVNRYAICDILLFDSMKRRRSKYG